MTKNNSLLNIHAKKYIELPLMPEDWDQLYDALFEDRRAEFLKILEQRKVKNRKLLQKRGVHP